MNIFQEYEAEDDIPLLPIVRAEDIGEYKYAHAQKEIKITMYHDVKSFIYIKLYMCE